MIKPFLTLTIGLIALSSCKNAEENKGIASGKIEYKITYLNGDLDKKTKELLPLKMKLVFNEEMAGNSIEGFLGLYKLNTITDFHARRCSTILKVFDKHYLFKGKREELMCCFDAMEDMEIQETDIYKEIAGFNCRKSIVTIPSENMSFDIYYTDEIALKHPNINNPYKDVEGVLMEFELKMINLKMRFTAEKFEPLKENDLSYRLPDKTKEVNREQMVMIMNKLIDN